MTIKIESIESIPNFTAPSPVGWVKTKYGWMKEQPELFLIQKVNEIIDFLNFQQKPQQVEQRKVEKIKQLILNAKTVKSEMEEMEGKEFSNGYQKALEDIFKIIIN